jgi:hypothetical protein
LPRANTSADKQHENDKDDYDYGNGNCGSPAAVMAGILTSEPLFIRIFFGQLLDAPAQFFGAISGPAICLSCGARDLQRRCVLQKF